MSFAFQARTTPDNLYFLPDLYVLSVVYTVAAIALLFPLTIIDVPVIADYPNHVARMHILGNINTEMMLSEHYVIEFDFIPNLAMDLAVPWLSKIVPLDVAGRLFLALTIISTLASVAFLHRTLFNRWSFTPLIALLFVYHGSLMAGMVNFSLGIGLVPAALALWIILQRASASWRILIGSAVALSLFFCHIVAFGAYGLLIIAYEAMRIWDERGQRNGLIRAVRNVLIAGLTGLIPTILFVRQLLRYASATSADSVLSFGNWSWKAKALLAPLANYDLTVDLASLAVLIGLALWAWLSGRLEIDRRIAPGLCLLALCFLMAPKALWTGGVFDQRLAILFVFVFIGGMRFRADDAVVRTGVSSLLIVLFLIRLGTITSAWLDHRDDLAEMRSAFGRMATGSKVLVVQPDSTAGPRLAPDRHKAFHHAAHMASLATLAVIERSAFVSSIYAIPGQQPLRLREPFQDLGGKGAAVIPSLDELAAAIDEAGESTPPQIRHWWRDFDYVLLIYGYGSGARNLRGDLPLETLMDGDIVDLFKIKAG